MSFAVKYLSSEQLLLVIENVTKDPSEEAATTLNKIFYELVTENTMVDVIELLLKNPRINPASNSNIAIITASEKGNVKIVELLLKDKRANPNKAILCAVENNHLEVVEMLLKDNRVDPGYSSDVICRPSAKGYHEIVKLLLTDRRADPNSARGYSIGFAAKNGHIETVKVLLEDSRTDVSIDDNYAIKNAYKNGHTEITKLLLSKINFGTTTDVKVLDIIKKFFPIVAVPEVVPVTSIAKIQSLEEAKTLILSTMELHNMTKVHIEDGSFTFSFKR
jgi:hypothetical protein